MRKLFQITQDNSDASNLHIALLQLSQTIQTTRLSSRGVAMEGFLDVFREKQEAIKLNEKNVLEQLHQVKKKVSTDVVLTHSFFVSASTAEVLMRNMDDFIKLSGEIDHYQKLRLETYSCAVKAVESYLKKDFKTVTSENEAVKTFEQKLDSCFSGLGKSNEDIRVHKNGTYSFTRDPAGGLGDFPDEGSPEYDYSFYGALRAQSRADILKLTGNGVSNSLKLDAAEVVNLIDKMEKLINSAIHLYEKWCSTSSAFWNEVKKISTVSNDESLNEFTGTNIQGLLALVYQGDVDRLPFEYMHHTLKIASSLMRTIDSKLNAEY